MLAAHLALPFLVLILTRDVVCGTGSRTSILPATCRGSNSAYTEAV